MRLSLYNPNRVLFTQHAQARVELEHVKQVPSVLPPSLLLPFTHQRARQALVDANKQFEDITLFVFR